MWFHASLARIAQIGPDLNLAPTPAEAIPYIGGNRGFLHYVEVHPDAVIADEDILKELAGEEGYAYVFEAADDPDVRTRLRQAGFAAVMYDDLGPDNAYEHTTLRILDPRAARVVKVQRLKGRR